MVKFEKAWLFIGKCLDWALAILICNLLLTMCHKCNEKPCKSTLIDSTTSISFANADPAPVQVRDSLVPVYIYDTVYNDVPADVDTAAILKEFFAEYFTSDSIRIDSSFLIVIDDIITRNKVKSRKVYHQKLLGDKVITHKITKQVPAQKPKPELMIGALIGTGRNGPLVGPAANITLSGKGSISYTYEIFNRSHIATIYINPFRKKK